MHHKVIWAYFLFRKSLKPESKNMHHKTLVALSADLQNKKISSTELTQHFLQRIKLYDSQLNSFVTVTEELALAQAKTADQQIAKANAHPLTGIPIAHK